jgi:hypothetical protein
MIHNSSRALAVVVGSVGDKREAFWHEILLIGINDVLYLKMTTINSVI